MDLVSAWSKVDISNTYLNLIAILPSPKKQWEEVKKLVKLVDRIIWRLWEYIFLGKYLN